jgi:hypothetical protein
MKIVAIDESGDLGSNLERGASRLIVLSFVSFDSGYLEKLNLKLEEISNFVYKNTEHEFHFTNETYKQRKYFFEKILDLDISINVFVLDKTKTGTKDYLSVILSKAFKVLNTEEEHHLKFDGILTRKVKKERASEIRKLARENNLKINKLGFYDSRVNRDIQIADMMAGICRKNISDNEPNDRVLFNIIKNKASLHFL